MSWWGIGMAIGGSIDKKIQDDKKAKSDKDAENRRLAAVKAGGDTARGDLAPYREFGEEQLAGLQAWQASPEGQFQAPTMEDVTSSPGYESRLGAVESSAAARGSLFSGNALRNIGEFGSSEYGKEYNRKQTEYQNELNKRMGFANLGYGAAGGSAGLAQNLGQRLANLTTNPAAPSQALQQGFGQAAGSYQGQQNWNSFLNRIGSEKKSGGGWNENDYGVDDSDDSDYGW